MRKPFSRPISISKHGESHRWKHHIVDIFITMEIFTVLKNFSVQVNWIKGENGWMEQIMDVVCSMG